MPYVYLFLFLQLDISIDVLGRGMIWCRLFEVRTLVHSYVYSSNNSYQPRFCIFCFVLVMRQSQTPVHLL